MAILTWPMEGLLSTFSIIRTDITASERMMFLGDADIFICKNVWPWFAFILFVGWVNKSLSILESYQLHNPDQIGYQLCSSNQPRGGGGECKTWRIMKRMASRWNNKKNEMQGWNGNFQNDKDCETYFRVVKLLSANLTLISNWLFGEIPIMYTDS